MAQSVIPACFKRESRTSGLVSMISVETELLLDLGRLESFCLLAAGIEKFHLGLVVPRQYYLPVEVVDLG